MSTIMLAREWDFGKMSARLLSSNPVEQKMSQKCPPPPPPMLAALPCAGGTRPCAHEGSLACAQGSTPSLLKKERRLPCKQGLFLPARTLLRKMRPPKCHRGIQWFVTVCVDKRFETNNLAPDRFDEERKQRLIFKLQISKGFLKITWYIVEAQPHNQLR